jgi:hypothetical protein
MNELSKIVSDSENLTLGALARRTFARINRLAMA